MLSKIKTSHLSNIFIVLLFILIIIMGRDVVAKIKARGAFNPVSKASLVIRDYCANQDNVARTKGKENCYTEEFRALAEKSGLDFSFQTLSGVQSLDPEARGCHLIAHGIGYGLYKRDPNDWRTLVQDMPTICNYGAIHGVIESYVNSLPGKSLTREIIPTICGEIPRADCNHIVGHLLLVETLGDVPEALALCGVFTDKIQNDFCLTGVFMEQETALNLVEHDLAPESWLDWPARLDSLEELCRSFEGANASACWKEIVHVALAKFNNDPKKTWDFCNTAQVADGARECVTHSIGIIGATRNFDLPSLRSVCTIPQKNNPNFEMECYPALVSSSLSTIPTMVPQSVSFCNSLESQFQPSCFSMIGAVGNAIPLVKDLSQEACISAVDAMQAYCLGSSTTFSEPVMTNRND